MTPGTCALSLPRAEAGKTRTTASSSLMHSPGRTVHRTSSDAARVSSSRTPRPVLVVGSEPGAQPRGLGGQHGQFPPRPPGASASCRVTRSSDLIRRSPQGAAPVPAGEFHRRDRHRLNCRRDDSHDDVYMSDSVITKSAYGDERHSLGQARPDEASKISRLRSAGRALSRTQSEGPLAVCSHVPRCPSAEDADRDAAHTVSCHPEQGWSLLCNGVVLFDDGGEILPSGRAFPSPDLGRVARSPATARSGERRFAEPAFAPTSTVAAGAWL